VSDTKVAEALEGLTREVQGLSGKLDTHIEVQDERCSHSQKSICDLQEDVYGKNGAEGLKTKHTRLSTKVTVVFGIVAASATASIGSLIAWALSLINSGAATK